jgi:hypothetical protein
MLFLTLSNASSAKTIQVTVAPNNNLVFQPSSITLNVGDTVQWVWSGSNHSTTSGTCSGGGGGYGGGGSCTPDKCRMRRLPSVTRSRLRVLFLTSVAYMVQLSE